MSESEYNELGNQRIFINWTKYHSFISQFAVLRSPNFSLAGQPREFGRVVIRGPLLLTIFLAGFWTIAFEGHKILWILSN